MYNVKSLKAEEFISDEEIKETLEYAEANKNNIGLIDAIIEKAKLKKGLTHREASVLLACEIPEKLDEVYKLAQQIKKDFYGNRKVIFILGKGRLLNQSIVSKKPNALFGEAVCPVQALKIPDGVFLRLIK